MYVYIYQELFYDFEYTYLNEKIFYNQNVHNIIVFQFYENNIYPVFPMKRTMSFTQCKDNINGNDLDLH